MSNLLWYKQNGKWINPNLLVNNKSNYAEAIIYYKSKNKWILLDKEKYQLDLNYISKCQDKESFISLLKKSFPMNKVETGFEYYSLTKYGVGLNNIYTTPSDFNGYDGKSDIPRIARDHQPSFIIYDVKKPKFINLEVTANSVFILLSFTGNISNTSYYILTWLRHTNYPYQWPEYHSFWENNLNTYEMRSSMPTTFSKKINVPELDKCFIDERDTSYTVEFYSLGLSSTFSYLSKFILEY